MVNKAIVILINLLIFSLSLQINYDHRFINFEDLPTKAKSFVRTYFGHYDIRFVKIDITMTKTNYTVQFENDMKIEFNSNGDWDEVNSPSDCLPSDFLNNMILNHLNKNYPDCCLHVISKGKHKFEVELTNGLELVFNKKGEFLRYDHKILQNNT